jgi:hypothetical protein
VLAQLALTRGAYEAYAAAQAAPLTRLFRLFRNPALVVAGHGGDGTRTHAMGDADFELGRLLALHAHPSLASLPNLFPVAAHRAAA